MRTRLLPLALAFAGWLDRRRVAVLGVALAATVAAFFYAEKLPVHGDFSHLLPQSSPSVMQLRQLEQRVANLGTLLVVVEGTDPAARAQAAQELRVELEKIDRRLVANVIFDDHAARQFIWDNRFLYADKADLLAARDALADEIRKAKLKANPLYVDFDDEEAAPTGEGLQAKLDDARAKKDVVGRVSSDGRLQLIIVRTAFEAGTASKARELIGRVEIMARLAEAEHGVTVAMTGDAIIGLAEHDALLQGMTKAAVVTVLIVAFGLMLFYRSLSAIAALFLALGVGVAMTFAFTRLAIGHLNMASAFLSSIVVGNGINFGILLLARHLEERRRGLRGVEAIGHAIAGTFTGTLAAALTAAVAYGSLAATTFRGFKHFGIIGGIGMVLCWITAYTVLPAALAVLERRGLRVRPAPRLGAVLARILPRTHARVAIVAALAMVVTLAGGVATWEYLQNPYESDFRNLRSSTDRILEAKAWKNRVDDSFGHNLSGGFVVATRSRADARAVASRLLAISDKSGHARPLISVVRSIDDVMPKDQDAKLAILGELRHMIDHESRNLGDAEKARLAELRPPDGIVPLGEADLPGAMAMPFTEKDGRRGLILFADSSARLNTWKANDILEFTSGINELDLPEGTALGGANFVFADVLRSMQADGPRATVIAIIGAVLVIALLIGLGRHGAVVLVCMSSGVLLMLAGTWLIGLRVNFLDFVALPITIGIGIDYAVNIVARARQDGDGHEGRVGAAREALVTTGGAVALCSFTTIVGYGSLLLSANPGIHSFGLAAILGELTCIGAALVLAPTLLQLVAPRTRSSDAAAPDARGEQVR